MASWQLQDAKARFSEVVNTAETDGPQVITRRGVETAVVMSMGEWRKLKAAEAERPRAPGELTAEERAESEASLRFFQSGPDFEIPHGTLRMRDRNLF